jgi:hypothetical protein
VQRATVTNRQSSAKERCFMFVIIIGLFCQQEKQSKINSRGAVNQLRVM